MKTSVKGVLVMAAFVAIVSCKKDDVDNCRTCEASNINSFEICEEDGLIFVNGTEIPDSEGISLDRIVRELEADEDYDNLSCR